MSVHWPIVRTCLRFPRRILAIDDRRSYRGVDLLVGALHLASEIERRCSTPTVGILLPTGGLFPMAALAAWMTGRIVVPLNYLLRPDELQFVVDDCGTDLILTAGALLEHLDATPRVRSLVKMEDVPFAGFPEPRWPAPASDDDLAVILYTSGTSGRPKGVMLTHGNLSANVRQIGDWVDFTRADILLGVLPQFHSFGLTVLTLLPLTAGCKVVYSARFVPHRIVKAIREHRPTAFIAIPSMFNAILHVKDAGPADFTSLRFTVSGSEPLPESVFTAFRARFGITINEGFGLTETSPVTNWCRPQEWRPHSVGRPLPRIVERIVSPETGLDVPPGADGEVWISGPNIMRGYFNRPDETAAVFTPDGFFRTGDIGRLDDDGHLFITGRLKEMMKVGGENVFPREIEEILNLHPAVEASGVIGISDSIRGELPVAFVEFKDGQSATETDLTTWCRQRLAGYKVPRSVVIVPALPRNPTGKIMRRELRKLMPAS